MKFLLPYMDNKEGRVCQVCCNAMLRGNQALCISYLMTEDIVYGETVHIIFRQRKIQIDL